MEFLAANDYLKVLEALASFVLHIREAKKRKKQTEIIIGNKNKLLLYHGSLSRVELFNEQLKIILIRELHAFTSHFIYYSTALRRMELNKRAELP